MSFTVTTWTPQRVSELVELRKQGLAFAVLGPRFGVSPDAARIRYQSAVKKPRPLTADYLGERIEAYLARVASDNGYHPDRLKRECYGWR